MVKIETTEFWLQERQTNERFDGQPTLFDTLIVPTDEKRNTIESSAARMAPISILRPPLVGAHCRTNSTGQLNETKSVADLFAFVAESNLLVCMKEWILTHSGR